MLAMFLLLCVVPVIDLGVKALLGSFLVSRVVPLGPLGSLRLVSGRLWLARMRGMPAHRPAFVWSIWAGSALALGAAIMFLPEGGVFAGLLLGGALSHAIEVTRRGVIRDYVCLRFWPAFNLADVAITLGGLGLMWCLAIALKGGLP